MEKIGDDDRSPGLLEHDLRDPNFVGGWGKAPRKLPSILKKPLMNLLHHDRLSQTANYSSAGLIFDHSPHYLDHLGPFCALMGWPLIICEGDIANLARAYYPGLIVIEKNLWDLALPKQIVSCSPFQLFEQTFPTSQLQDKKFLWLPHGNSDKGWADAFCEGVFQKEIALVYGQRMLDFFAAKNVKPLYIRIGDFRHHYFLQHRAFYDSLIQTKLPQAEKIVLYAPTWDDAEKSNSFWSTFPILASAFHPDTLLLIKLHPNTHLRYPAELEILKGRYQTKPNLFFLEDFPPIHPLLNRSRYYLGDMSSIGYDFLRYLRPMFFFNPNHRDPHSDPGLSLSCCGHLCTPEQFPTLLFTPDSHLFSLKQKMHQATFDSIDTWEPIANSILKALS
jgi:hypothetical protein